MMYQEVRRLNYSGVTLVSSTDGKEYVKKLLKKDSAYNQMDIMFRLIHPNLLYGKEILIVEKEELEKWKDPLIFTNYAVIMEKREGDLRHFVASGQVKNETDDDLKMIVFEMLNAVMALKEGGFYHGDVSPYNFLVSKDRVELFDFETSRLIGLPPHQAANAVWVSPEWYAHQNIGLDEEAYCEKMHYDEFDPLSSDIYALGCTIFYLLTGQNPNLVDFHLDPSSSGEAYFGNEVRMEIYADHILTYKPRLNLIKQVELRDLIGSMLAKRSFDRPTIEQLIHDPVFKHLEYVSCRFRKPNLIQPDPRTDQAIKIMERSIRFDPRDHDRKVVISEIIWLIERTVPLFPNEDLANLAFTCAMIEGLLYSRSPYFVREPGWEKRYLMKFVLQVPIRLKGILVRKK